jgi:hypothetical protein
MQYLTRAVLGVLFLSWVGAAPMPAQSPANRVPFDFNGDGQSDLVWINYNTGQMGPWYMNGATIIANLDFPSLPDPNLWLAAVGDIDGDGKPDLLFRNYQTGDNLAWIMDGTTLLNTVALPPQPDRNWALSGAADFNGDGQTDLVWRNYQTGENAIWLMNGFSLAQVVTLPTESEPRWSLEAVGDFNGDGYPDLVWRNIWTGDNKIWLMNGTNRTAEVALPRVGEPNWGMTGNLFAGPDGQIGFVWYNYLTGAASVWYLDWTDPAKPSASAQSLPKAADPNWQMVDPLGSGPDEMLTKADSDILDLEQSTLSDGGGYNAYDASGYSSLYNKWGGKLLTYRRRATTNAMFQFRKQFIEKTVAQQRRELEVQIIINGGYRGYDPETGREAVFTSFGSKEFVISDDTWP